MYNRTLWSLKEKSGILVDNVYQRWRFGTPSIFKAGAEVVTVGATAGAAYTSNWATPVCEKSYDQVSAAGFDGVVIPGGCSRSHSPAPGPINW